MKTLGLLIVSMLLHGSPLAGSDIQARLDEYLQQEYRRGPTPGFSVVVVKGDQVIFLKGYGVETSGAARPMSPQTASAIGSLTKSFTALAIMQLVDAGKMRLDDPVVKYLPWFQTANPERSDLITVRMLLNNTSGLWGGVSKSGDVTDQALERLVQAMRATYLSRKPGLSYEYSNDGFSLAGLLVSVVSGVPYSEYMDQYVFRPLEMRRTTTDPRRFDELGVLYGHYLGLQEGIPAEKDVPSGEYIPAGSYMRSTAADLGHYLIALLNEGRYRGRRLISSNGLAEMWRAQASFKGLEYEDGGEGTDWHYGLGWMISEIEGQRLIHHGGSTGTMSSFTMLDPTRKIGVSILLNMDHTFLDRYQFTTEITLAYNVLRLVAEEPVSAYGLPRIPDPSRNDYVLPDSLKARYGGEYLFQGGINAWFLSGARMQIRQGKEGKLEGDILQGRQVINQFQLDFLNPGRAVSRNIGKVEDLVFRLRPDGTVEGMNLAGSAFLKQTNQYLANYSTRSHPNGQLAFALPITWEVDWQDSGFQARNALAPDTYLIGKWQRGNEPGAQRSFHEHLNEATIIASGTLQTETVGGYFWREQAWVTEREGQRHQYLTLTINEGEKYYYFLLHTPEGQLTRAVQEVIIYLQLSVLIERIDGR